MRPARAALALAVVLAAGAGAADAQDAASRVPKSAPPPVINWLAAPSYADVVAAYPAQARQGRQAGSALLRCRFKSQGQVGDCEIGREEPTGQGFGASALSLAPLFRGPTTDARGHSVEGARVQIPFVFAPAALGPAPAAGGPPIWLKLPSPEQFAAAFPKAASEKGILTARVVLDCGVAAEGGLSACKPVSEDPTGYGLGQATLPLTADFKLNIWSAEGAPVVGGQIRVPIRYAMTQAPVPKP
jgi:TonB family protein